MEKGNITGQNCASAEIQVVEAFIATTVLKIWSKVQGVEGSDFLVRQTHVTATAIRILSGALSVFQGFLFIYFRKLHINHKTKNFHLPRGTLTILSRVMKSFSRKLAILHGQYAKLYFSFLI